VQAERDAYSAEVSRIQADADLSYARVALRLNASRPLGKEIH
jgi:outer membrane protein TolC